MAKVSGSILGPLKGQVGPVVASSWKGIPYLKSAHGPRTKKISKKERANRQRFKLAQEWLGPLLYFVREGFRGYSPTVEGFIAAKSYLLKNAMGPDGKIYPALMKVSFGDLSLSENIKVKPTAEGDLQFTWSTAAVKPGHGRDLSMMLVYDIKNERAFSDIAGAFRESGSALMKLSAPKGYNVHVYFAFVSNDRKRQSDSIYLGEVSF